MQRLSLLCVLALTTIPPLLASPPVDVPAEVKGEPGAFVTVRAKTDGKAVRFVPLDAGLNVFPSDLLTDRRATVVSATKPGRYRVLAYSSVKDDPTEPAVVTVVIGDAPVPPPKPKPDEPDVTPAPEELKTFRVVLVFESGATLTQKQFAVMYGKPVSDWLDANTTKVGESAGWRRYDKDAVPTGDRPEFATLWAAKPALSALPAAVVERNGKVSLVTFADTPEATIISLTKAREGK